MGQEKLVAVVAAEDGYSRGWFVDARDAAGNHYNTRFHGPLAEERAKAYAYFLTEQGMIPCECDSCGARWSTGFPTGFPRAT